MVINTNGTLYNKAAFIFVINNMKKFWKFLNILMRRFIRTYKMNENCKNMSSIFIKYIHVYVND